MSQRNPTRQDVKKAIRRLAYMTGLTIAQVRPTFTSGAHRTGVVNLVRNTWKFEEQTVENIHLECDFLIINRAVWLAIPYSMASFTWTETYPRSYSDVWRDWLEAIPPAPFVDRNISFLPNTVKELHGQQLQTIKTQDQEGH